MRWSVIIAALRTGLVGWLGIVALTVVVGAIRGRVVTGGMLSDRAGGALALHRVQLMIVTLGFAAAYVAHAMALAPGSALPDVKPIFLIMLTGSQSAYLAGKYLNS